MAELLATTNRAETSPRPELVAARAAALRYQSPYFFLRELPAGPQQAHFGTGAALRFGGVADEEVLGFDTAAGPGQWLLQHLAWDSSYFGTPTYRLFTGLMAPNAAPDDLVAAAQQLRRTLAARGSFYTFSIVPTEDVALLQALTGAGWRLVETRLHYYHDELAAFAHPRHAVRLAEVAEAALIGQVAAAARNPFDRYHADPWFGAARADAYLARYAQAAVEGLADAVLVPAEAGLPVESFLAISDLATDSQLLETGLSRVLLTAVGPANRGWHVKLVAETVHRARERGQRYVLMTTQATNQAVFRSSEKLGFKLGGSSQVLACHS